VDTVHCALCHEFVSFILSSELILKICELQLLNPPYLCVNP
jgi:hypothetical protein